MKKLLLSLTLVAGLGLAANAQNSPIKIGVKAGVAFPNVSFSEDDGGDYKANTSFYLGGLVDISLSEMFSVQPGLTLIGKGTKLKESESFSGYSVEESFTRSLMYLEVPVNLVANFETGAGKVFVGAGPYYAMAISGKDKYSVKGTVDGENISESESEDIKFGKDGDVKRGDVGLNFLGGYQLKNGFNVHVGYGLGLGNISTDSDFKAKNKVFSVGVGFTF